ncbi:hypothetical protein [Catenulispora rubra]|uniref:hypothetical protein n=1 Tax=Catenulispora rubra TaxID=280293 RepID=UPI00189223FA|nr:hypothetical protein [Catenulispora rubra]
MSHVDQQNPDRRTLLRIGAVAGSAAGLGAAGVFGARAANATAAMQAGSAARRPSQASDANDATHSQHPSYPPHTVDTSHCTPEVADIFRRVFAAKSNHDTAAFMAHFSTSNPSYSDGTLGLVLSGWQAINTEFTSLLAGAPAGALSYPLTIVGDARSASVEFVDTPAFFGAEVRALSSVTFDGNRKITRWVDYWDRRSSLFPFSDGSAYPTDFHDSAQNADHAIVQAAQRLQAAFLARDAAAAVALMSADVVYEDLAAHTRVRGQLQLQRYYTRALMQLPYGPGAALVHVEGSRQGGGYEWTASPALAKQHRGHTAIALDGAGKISRLTTVYDSSLLSYPAYQALVGLAAEAPQS